MSCVKQAQPVNKWTFKNIIFALWQHETSIAISQ